MKNRQLKIFTPLCISVLLLSCGTKENNKYKIAGEIMASKSFVYINNPDIVTIDNEKSETIPYEEINNILKNVKYIPLISKEPIGEFRKIIIHKEHIYLLDASIAEKIFIFNMKGEIIKVIDSRGSGPNEYLGLMDMTISSEDDYLVIADRLAPFVLYFSLDGEFVKKTRCISNTTVVIMNGKFLNQVNTGQSYDDNVNYHLVISIGDSVIRKGFPFYPLQMNDVFIHPFWYNYKNELLFCPYYCDTVYQIINDSVYTAKYIVRHSNSIWEKKYNERMSFNDYARLYTFGSYRIDNACSGNGNFRQLFN
jgi:sporulation protein YlmC with PRC-barrel domain